MNLTKMFIVLLAILIVGGPLCLIAGNVAGEVLNDSKESTPAPTTAASPSPTAEPTEVSQSPTVEPSPTLKPTSTAAPTLTPTPVPTTPGQN